MKSHKVT